MLFTGHYEDVGGAKGRIRIPEEIRKRLPSQSNPLYGTRWVLMPWIDACVRLYISERFDELLHSAGDARRTVPREDVVPVPQAQSSAQTWDRHTCRLVASGLVRPLVPDYAVDWKARGPVEQAVAAFRAEVKKLPESMTNHACGHRVERLLAELLESFGITTELNVRLAGGEVDILAITYREGSAAEAAIIEVKTAPRSRNPVRVSQVHRLYGLQQMLGKGFSVKNAMIFSTTGFTRNAKSAATVGELDALDYDALTDWLLQSMPRAVNPEIPFFRVARMGLLGELRLHPALTSLLGDLSALMAVGARDRLELRRGSEWQAGQADRLTKLSALMAQVRERTTRTGGGPAQPGVPGELP